jgi:hypothetical protein
LSLATGWAWQQQWRCRCWCAAEHRACDRG